MPTDGGGHGEDPGGDRGRPAVWRGPDRELGPRARRYVDRTAAADRGALAEARLQQVRTEEARIRRRQRTLARLGWLAVVIALVGGGWLMGGPVGAGIGSAATAALFGVQQLVAALARRRGATAWDWRARRYRLVGSPASRVQQLDDRTQGRTDTLGLRRDR